MPRMETTGFATFIKAFWTSVLEQPAAELVVQVIWKLPYELKVCIGFCKLEVEPSPKFHNQAVAPTVWSVKVVVNGVLQLDTFAAVNAVVGGFTTLIGLVTLPLQPEKVLVRVTLKGP